MLGKNEITAKYKDICDNLFKDILTLNMCDQNEKHITFDHITMQIAQLWALSNSIGSKNRCLFN
jgi:hypothetical protein